MATTRENKTISQFKSQLIGGGARPNLFEVELTTLPAGIAWPADNFRYMCKAAQLPASVIANIDIPFRGRILKLLETELSNLGVSLLLMMKTLELERQWKSGAI